MLALTFHTDLGHGWLEVDRSLIELFNLDISDYSYIKGTKAYLEEDRDAGKLIDVLRAKHIEYKTTNKHFEGNHPIRNYRRFN